MANSAPHGPHVAPDQPEQPTTPPVKNRTLRLTAAGYRATDPPPGRRATTSSVIQQFSKDYGRVNDHLVAAIEILTRIGYTVGGAADELAERIATATAVAYQREREEAQA